MKWLVVALFLISSAHAAILLPYTVRHRAYSGYQATVRGDNETIGMAGATVAIPNSISSLETNPAGLTMTMGNVTAQINSNSVSDKTLTGEDSNAVTSTQWGLTVTPNDWGYALSYYSPSFEGGNYISPNTGHVNEYEVSTKQLRLSVSHAMLNKQLSVGGSLELNHGIRRIGDLSDNSDGVSFQLGAIYHLGRHYLLGASFSPPQELGSSHPNSGGAELPGFAQPIRSPILLNIGAGWIPNRFFSVGASVISVGAIENAALLRDESITVGDHLTLQPRMGASYIFGQYDNLKLGVAAGSYYETSRTAGIPNRIHGTFSVQVNPYFINTGIGFDRAVDYNNFFVSIGFDIVRTVRLIGLIPKDSVPAYHGFFPQVTKRQADGLPDGLTVGEAKEYESPSVGDVKMIIENIPKNISNKFKGLPTVGPSPKPAPKPIPTKKSKAKKKKKPVSG